MINDFNAWQKERESIGNDYAMAIWVVADRVMQLLDKTINNVAGEGLNAHDLILQADKDMQQHITGNQAAYVANLVVKYDSRSKDFMRSWNKFWGRENDTNGVINPAIVEI